ncbi:MAG: hypothetical protein IJS08_18860 [Victivallales bacterium]|nr:hypothetical protein [Victivallales bacterium]
MVKRDVLVDNLKAFRDAGKCFINVAARQEAGTYALGECAEAFRGSIELLVDKSNTGKFFNVPEGTEGSSDIKYKDVTYILQKRGGKLELIVRI